MDFKTQLGLDPDTADSTYDHQSLLEYVNLKLTSIGQHVFGDLADSEFFGLSK